MLDASRTSYKNILISAWNDSGAGNFMRMMDGTDKVFSFPFELLLGAESNIGILNEPSLVSGKYRWNVFRASEKVNAATKQESLRQGALDPSESELREWLAERKFFVLSEYRESAKALLQKLARQPNRQRYLLEVNDVIAYIESLKAIFSEGSSDFNLIHCPCAALDWESPQFWQVYDMAILIVIDPKWGLGNMHSRNLIAADRYLERWLRVNEASFHLKQNHPENVLILCSSLCTDQQLENLARAHEFLDIGNIRGSLHEPTLLGEKIGETGFPFGGILNWSLDTYNSSIAKANEILADVDNKTAALLSKCDSLYSLLKS